ncbi:MAG TPA: acyltransferase [Burkholderiaceae bacterium]|jgi:predicted LPLAT superfamily acyltransferase
MSNASNPGNPRSSHWAQQRETTFVAGIWLLYGVYRLTGRWLFRLCMAPVVLVHWLARPALRQASLQYLKRLHATHTVFAKPPGAWQSLRHVALFADTMLDKLLVMGGRYAAENVHEYGYEPVRQARQSGQGGIFVTAHMGCLELCRVMSAHESTFRLNVLVHTQHAQAFNRILQRLNPQAHVNLIEVTDMGVPLAMMLAEKVAAGEFIAIAGDRVPVRQSKTVTVDFLGHPAPLPVGPYVLASLLKCPLYLLGCMHEGRGYAVHFERLAERVELPRATRQAALQAHAQQFADAVAALLCRSPYDWFNFFPFWDQAHAD